MIILGFGSKARQGKDTAAEAIYEHFFSKIARARQHDLTTRVPNIFHVNFADGVYQEAREKYSMTVKDGDLLQRIGHGRRQENPRYWIDKVHEKIPDIPGVAVIGDLRYLNEAESIKQHGGYVIQVSRKNQDGTPFISDDRPADHPSEIELDGYNFDYRIEAKTGEATLVAEQAITLAEYIVGLHK